MKMLNLEQYIRSNNEELVNIHWNETINEYVKRLNASKTLFKKLSEKEYFKSSNTLKENIFFKEINSEISRYISDSKNPSYQIAIVGAVKAGKSTLINALLSQYKCNPRNCNINKNKNNRQKFNYSKILFKERLEKNLEWCSKKYKCNYF